MDWLKEILTKAGVEEEKVTSILESVKKEVPTYYVPKNDFNEKVTEVKNLTTEKQTLTSQLEELKKVEIMVLIKLSKILKILLRSNY